MDKISLTPAKDSPKPKKNIQLKPNEFEKEQINTDCSNELSPTLNHISNIMSPHTVFQGSLNFLQSDISTIQDNNPLKKTPEDIIKKINMEFGKTSSSFEFPSYVSTNLIKGFFIVIVKERNYEIIEQGINHCLAIYKETFSFGNLFKKCLPWRSGQGPMAAIRILISLDKINNKKIAIVKILQEKNNYGNELLEILKTKIQEFEISIKNFDISDPEKLDRCFPGLVNQLNNGKDITYDPYEDMSSRIILPSTLESYSYYYFHKILTSESYNLGKRVSDFISDFLHNYRSIKESADLLPQPMESILSLINEIINILFSDFNYGKSEMRQLMPFARKSVEKYIFSRLHSVMISIYREKYHVDDSLFVAKTKELQKIPFLTLLKSLEILKKFWLIDPEYLSSNEELIFCDKDSFNKPYEGAIIELNKLNFAQAPCEKLTILLMANSMMRTSVVDFHKGKVELSTMDDELPLTIYVISQTKIENLMAELSFVEDYIKFFQEYESELRLMTNLRVSFQYILSEWKLI